MKQVKDKKKSNFRSLLLLLGALFVVSSLLLVGLYSSGYPSQQFTFTGLKFYNLIFLVSIFVVVHLAISFLVKNRFLRIGLTILEVCSFGFILNFSVGFTWDLSIILWFAILLGCFAFLFFEKILDLIRENHWLFAFFIIFIGILFFIVRKLPFKSYLILLSFVLGILGIEFLIQYSKHSKNDS